MIRERATRRKVTALAMTAVMLGLLLGMPLLDLGREPGSLAVTDPDAPSGWVQHDHSLCMLYAAAPWSPAPVTAPLPDPVVRVAAAPADRPTRTAATRRHRPQPRAPPVS